MLAVAVHNHYKRVEHEMEAQSRAAAAAQVTNWLFRVHMHDGETGGWSAYAVVRHRTAAAAARRQLVLLEVEDMAVMELRACNRPSQPSGRSY